MKTGKNLSLIVILTASVLMSSCWSKINELESQNADLLQANDSISGNLSMLVSTFNQIERNIEEIKLRENMIELSGENAESDSMKQVAIINDIQKINSLMEQNQRKIAELTSSLSAKDKEFKQMVSRLNKRIKTQADEIESLKKNLEAKNIENQGLRDELVILTARVDTLQETTSYQSKLISQQTEDLQQKNMELEYKEAMLNTAYLAIGEEKTLLENQVIVKEGGLLGIGSGLKLKDEYNAEMMKKVNISSLNEIPVTAKKVELVTSHPESSYEWRRDESGAVSALTIHDPGLFWSNSKVLVIVTR